MEKQNEAHATAIEALQAELASFQGKEGGREGGREGRLGWKKDHLFTLPDSYLPIFLLSAAAAQAEAGKEGGKEEGEAAALREELAAHQSIVEGLRLRVGEKERAVSELQQDKVELEEKV